VQALVTTGKTPRSAGESDRQQVVIDVDPQNGPSRRMLNGERLSDADPALAERTDAEGVR